MPFLYAVLLHFLHTLSCTFVYVSILKLNYHTIVFDCVVPSALTNTTFLRNN